MTYYFSWPVIGNNTSMHSEPRISTVLASLMERKGNISANALARATDVPQPTITRLLHGRSRDPRDVTIAPLADYFGVSLAQMRGEAPLPWEKSDGHDRVKTDGVPYKPKRQQPDELAAYRKASPTKQVDAIRQILGTAGSIDMGRLRDSIAAICSIKEAGNFHMKPEQFADYVVAYYNFLQDGNTQATAHAKLVRLIRAA